MWLLLVNNFELFVSSSFHNSYTINMRDLVNFIRYNLLKKFYKIFEATLGPLGIDDVFDRYNEFVYTMVFFWLGVTGFDDNH